MRYLLILFLMIPSLCFAQADPVLDYAEYIGIDDAGGYYTGDEVEAALQEVGAKIIDGTGTTGTIPKWTGSKLLGDSIITESGTQITIESDVIANDYIKLADITFSRTNGRVSAAAIAGGRTIVYTRDSSEDITSSTDGTRTVTLTYDDNKNILTKVVTP